MADNVVIPAQGTGDSTPTVATEKIAGVDFQKIKLIDATAGSTTPVGTAANPLRVDPSGVTSPVSIATVPSHNVTNAGVFAVQASQSGPFAVTGSVALASTATIQGTVTANVSGTVPVSQAGTWAVQGSVALASTATVTGTLAVTQSGTWQNLALGSNSTVNLNQVGGVAVSLGQKPMGTSVPVVLASDYSLPSNTSVNLNQIAGTATAVNTGTASNGTQRVVIATDQPALTNAQPVNSVGTGTNASGQVTVTNSSTTIIASRSGRRGVLVKNFQTVAVYVDASGGTATTSKSRLDPGAAQFYPVTSAITGITSAAYTASPADAQIHYDEFY